MKLFLGFTGYPSGFMNPPDQRRTAGGQYYADYATISNQGGRSGPNRPPDIPQVNPAMPEYTDYQGTVMSAFVMYTSRFPVCLNSFHGIPLCQNF